MAQSRMAQSSVRLFSTGVPVSATRHRDGDRAQVAGGRGGGVLDVLRLVGHDQVPRRRLQRLVVAAHRAVGREHEAVRPTAARRSRRERPWKRRTATPGANRWISASQLPIRLAGQTTRVGPRGEPSLAAVEVQRDQGDRLAQPHVVGQAGTQPGSGELGEPGEAVPLVVAQRRRRAAGCRSGATAAASTMRSRSCSRRRAGVHLDLLAVEVDGPGERRLEGRDRLARPGRCSMPLTRPARDRGSMTIQLSRSRITGVVASARRSSPRR